MLKTCLALALLALSPLAGADIYKCRLPNGSTEISNKPCPSGSNTITSRPDEHVSEAARRQAEQEVERMRHYVEKREAAQRTDVNAEREQRTSNTPRQTPPPPPPRQYASTDECLQELDKMMLEITQRAQAEADCRNIPSPQPTYQPMPVAPYPMPMPMPRPYRNEPPIQPMQAPPPAPMSGPPISATELKKK